MSQNALLERCHSVHCKMIPGNGVADTFNIRYKVISMKVRNIRNRPPGIESGYIQHRVLHSTRSFQHTGYCCVQRWDLRAVNSLTVRSKLYLHKITTFRKRAGLTSPNSFIRLEHDQEAGQLHSRSSHSRSERSRDTTGCKIRRVGSYLSPWSR